MLIYVAVKSDPVLGLRLNRDISGFIPGRMESEPRECPKKRPFPPDEIRDSKLLGEREPGEKMDRVEELGEFHLPERRIDQDDPVLFPRPEGLVEVEFSESRDIHKPFVDVEKPEFLLPPGEFLSNRGHPEKTGILELLGEVGKRFYGRWIEEVLLAIMILKHEC